VYGQVKPTNQKNPLFAAKPRFRELWGKEKKGEEEEEESREEGREDEGDRIFYYIYSNN
jgi:hypothetical protein